MMHIDWEHFTPWTALLGGVLIGAAAGLFALANGRIAGISGILGGLVDGLFRRVAGDAGWRLAFLLGLVAAPVVYGLFAALPVLQVDADDASLVIAGLLVGIGTRMGAGCTSGHGVCGMARLSPRSMLATLCFMATGFATVLVLRHLFGF